MEIRPPILGSGCSDAYLDLRSQIMTISGSHEPDDSEMADFWTAKYVHECGHWLRFHGSTFGLLLTLMRLARDLTAINAFATLDQDMKGRVRAWRRADRPIYSFDVGYSSEPFGEDFGLGAQFWLDLYIAYSLLFDSASVRDRRWDYAEALRLSLADTWIYASEIEGFSEYPSNDEARRWLKGGIWGVDYDGMDLSTRLLWECASTLDEISYAEHASTRARDDISKMGQRKLEASEYGMPLRFANDLAPGGTSINMLWCVIDLATNPPVPFLRRNPDPVSWGNFYPPVRFKTAYEYIAENSWLEELCQGDDAGYLSTRRHICEGTGLEYGRDEISEGSPTSPGPVPSGPSLSPGALDALFGPRNLGHFDALVFASKSLLSWRESHPHRILRNDSPIQVTISPASNRESPLAAGLASHPFLMCLSSKWYKHPSLSETHVNNYLLSMLTSCALDNVLNSVGPLSQDHVPQPLQVEPSSLNDVVVEGLREFTGIGWSSSLL